MATKKQGSLLGKGTNSSWARGTGLTWGATANTISRRDAANLARRKSVGGKGG